MKKFYITILLALFVFGCERGEPASTAIKYPINIVATTGIVGDMVRNVGGEHVKVQDLMGSGVDPHLYKASAGDVSKLSNADMIFYSGLMLEGKMGDILVKLARNKPTTPLSDAFLEEYLREPPEFAGHFDPHVWFNVKLWSLSAETVANALSKYDPLHAEYYKKSAAEYAAKLVGLDAWVRGALSNIPEAQRVLVTAHDAFGYFGDAYGINVVGLQGVSTVAEFGLADVQRIVELLVARKVPAIFVESSIPRRSIEAVVEGARAKGHKVVIGGELYSDAMGKAGTDAGTYIGMVRANVLTIVGALKGGATQ